jgi:hypothetical protein
VAESTLTCFACEREPTRQCPRCGRPYCDEHGEDLCDVCLQPASGVPSFSLYRGSLLALLIGAALAVWLLVQPTGSEGDSGLRPTVLTPTAPALAAGETPGTAPTQGAATTPGAATTGTPPAATTGTPRPATTGTPAGTTPGASSGQYTVASGDTLSGVCAAQRPNLNSVDCVAQLRTLNGITGDSLSIGQVLRLP